MKKIVLTILILAISSLLFGQKSLQNKSNKIQEFLNKYNQFEMINGAVLVSEGDSILNKVAFGKANFEWNVPNTISTKFEIASVSKQFTAILILQLIDSGLISLDTKITDILKDYPKVTGDKITIEQLLTHTSGLIDTRHIKDFDITQGMKELARKELVSTFKDRELLFEPGTKWSYSNFGYNLLAVILETITKKSIDSLLSEKIFTPCRMTNSTTLENKGVISQMAYGYEENYYTEITRGQYHNPSWSIGSGNVVTTIDDYFKYYRSFNKANLLSKKMMAQLTKSETFSDAESGNKRDTKFCFMQDKLIYQEDTVAFPYASGSHYGAHSAVYHFYQDEKLIVIFINLKTQPMKMFEIGDNIAKILYGFPYDQPKDIYLKLFANDIKAIGIDKAIIRYKKLKSNQKDNLSQNPRDFNRLGYYYLR